MDLDFFLTLHTKIKSNYITDLNTKAKAKKKKALLKENVKVSSCDSHLAISSIHQKHKEQKKK